MSRTPFLDFKAVKAAITMEQILQHYGLIDRFKRSGDSLSGPCPIHRGENPTQFRISISKNIWNCFSECKRGGNVLDFISRMEDVSIHSAALKAIEWFSLNAEVMSATSDGNGDPSKEDQKKETASTKTKKAGPVTDANGSNKPLKFRLDKLDLEHPYLASRGLHHETVIDFSVGHCAKGMMAGRIAIPITNSEGGVVAYAGRFPGEPDANTPKYKLPPGFRKSLELFNIDRALKEPAEKPLMVVEGFFDCMKLWQNGCRKVVALMGSTMSGAQEDLIRKYSNGQSRVIVMFDEDEAGRLGREDAAVRLSKFVFVKIYKFDKEGRQPENLSAEEISVLLT